MNKLLKKFNIKYNLKTEIKGEAIGFHKKMKI
jgi:hypothetical protein